MIFFFTEHFGNTHNAAGIRSESFSDAIAKKNIPIHLISSNNRGQINSSGIIHSHIRSEDNPSYSWLHRLFKQVLFSIKCLFFFRKIKKGDIVLLTCPSFVTMVILGLVCILRKQTYFIDIRDLYPQALVDSGTLSKSSIFYILLKILASKVLSRATHIFCATESIKNELEKNNVELKFKVSTILNGYPKKLKKIKNEKFKNFTFICFGRIGYFQDEKALEMLIEKVLSLKFDFILISSGRKFEALKKKFNKSKQFKPMNLIDRNNLWELLSKCHVNVSLRTYDKTSKGSFPVRIWEAIGLGVPSLVSPHNSEAALFQKKHKIGWSIDLEDHEKANLVLSNISYKTMNKKVKCLKELSENYTRESQAAKAAEIMIC